mgnify:CR=1 FL=1
MSAKPIWLGGPVDGVPALLQPVAHALIEARDDVQALIPTLSMDELWARPGDAASAGFHALHSLGSLDRLFTYARGESLTETQLATLASEKTMDRAADGDQIVAAYSAGVDRAVERLRRTPEATLLEPREVGRGKLPSNVLGILVHAGDHTYRHVGQMITTAKIARAVLRPA